MCRRLVYYTLTVLLSGFCIAGCASARRGEPLRGPLRLDQAAEWNGRKQFLRHCQICHPGGEAGLGPALNNKPLPAFMIRMQVRNGAGAMPRFSSSEISSGELSDLIAYLQTLRKHRS